MPTTKTARYIPPSLYPRLGISTIDSTVLRYDADDDALVCFVMTDREGVRIAWDMCGSCLTRVTICRCPNGPTEPAYIYKLRTGEAPPADHIRPRPVLADRAPAPLSAEAQARVDKRVAEAVERAKALAAGDVYSTHRKGARKSAASAAAAPVAPARVLTSPCARHTAESRLNSDGTYSCTVAGCEGVI